ncbi:MAG: hypothetical protein AAGD13_07290 [Pseudomonadota bacterium]
MLNWEISPLNLETLPSFRILEANSLIAQRVAEYVAPAHDGEIGVDMNENAARAAWTAPELKSVKIATTAGKDSEFPSELPDGFGLNGGPS